jgi:hypothetical protein
LRCEFDECGTLAALPHAGAVLAESNAMHRAMRSLAASPKEGIW